MCHQSSTVTDLMRVIKLKAKKCLSTGKPPMTNIRGSEEDMTVRKILDEENIIASIGDVILSGVITKDDLGRDLQKDHEAPAGVNNY